MINRSVNIRIALQSAPSRADGSESRCSVRASELLTNRMGWLDNCSIDCFSTSSDFIFHATKCRPHTTDITASLIREERQFNLKKTQNIYYIVQTTPHKPHHLILLLSNLIENNFLHYPLLLIKVSFVSSIVHLVADLWPQRTKGIPCIFYIGRISAMALLCFY